MKNDRLYANKIAVSVNDRTGEAVLFATDSHGNVFQYWDTQREWVELPMAVRYQD